MLLSREDKSTLEHQIVINLDPCTYRTESDLHLILKILSECECKAKKQEILRKMKQVCLRLLNS